jgi:hypothetical protein
MRRWLGPVVSVLIVGCAAALLAAPANAASSDSPPLIAGRLAAVEGDVNIWRTEEDGGGEWDRALLNDVVTAGTGLATGDGRTEVRIGPHALRLGGGSTGGFSQLDFDVKSFNLERGVANFRLAPAQQGEAVSVSVAGVRVDLAAPGRYRIDAVDSSPLNITVFDGQATVRYGTSNVTVGHGQALLLTQSSMSFATASTTALDDWALARDLRYEQAQAPRYVSPYMTGYEELDTYGDWQPDATYGTVWIPRAVPVGWAPYRDGRWRWIAPWGWTWVDAAPWGYAPFHYGRWVMLGSRWCWWPGGYVARPVWAPALVGFVGSGAAVSAGFGGPVVGWYPLAPWHRYRPHYRTNNTYVTVINQTVIQQPPRGVAHDVNQRPGSTWVPQPRFNEPVAKVRLPARTEPVADLKPMAPPPRPKRTVAVADQPPANGPVARPLPPTMRPAPNVVQATPKASVAPPQSLPGAEQPLSQPAPIRRIEPRPLPPASREMPDRESSRPKPHQPAEIVPPYQQLQKPFPAEPARTPPAAPPTVRQPPPMAAHPNPKVPVAPAVTAAPPTAPPVQAHRGTPPGEVPRAAPPAQASRGQPAADTPPAGPQDAPAQPAPRQNADVRPPRPDVPRPKTSLMER